MTLSQIKDLLNAEIITDSTKQDVDIKVAKASDLMSDVLRFSEPGKLLLTGLTNPQVIRTCEIAGICAIAFVRGKQPTIETIKLAKKCNLTLLATKLSMFESCGILFSNGIRGVSIRSKS
jgi:tRNA G18 (ribose-2'-O)-methylase SpoU